MATIQEQINQLKVDKQNLVDNLVEKGVEATSDETFTTLVPKVKDIQGGIDINDYFETTYSGTSPDNWVRDNLLKKVPDLVIDDSVTSLRYFCSYTTINPKIICNSNITNMSNMYSNNEALNIDVSGLNTSKVTNMYQMFNYCKNITNLDLSSFDTSKVTEMANMFYSCSNLTSLILSSFNTSSVTNMYGMFSGCSKLTNLDLSGFDTSKLVSMQQMFYSCKNLTNLDLSNFDTSKVTNMLGCFQTCTSLETLNISTFDFSKLTGTSSTYSLKDMFSNCSNLTNLTFGNNLGLGYTANENSTYSMLVLSSCSNLTHDSLMDVINKLYDLASNGKNSQKLVLGSTNLAKLTEEEIAIATNKGWTVS